MALPPNPGEVTDAGVPLIWAWLVDPKNAGSAQRLNSATAAEIERRTDPSYPNFDFMVHLGDTPTLCILDHRRVWGDVQQAAQRTGQY